MREFIPIEKVDPIYFESSYYLDPDKGADKPYRLLAETMTKTSRVALAQTVFHNKESLVLIRSDLAEKFLLERSAGCGVYQPREAGY